MLVTQGPVLAQLAAGRRRGAGGAGAARRRLAGDRARPPARPGARSSTPPTRPTSSTPQAQPDTPKGVVVTHASLANKMLALGRRFRGDGRLPLGASHFLLSSIASIEQTLLPFMGGGAVVVISDAVRESAIAVLAADRFATGVTFISCMPSYLETIVRDAPTRLSCWIISHLAAKLSRANFKMKSHASFRSRASPISTARPKPRSTPSVTGVTER